MVTKYKPQWKHIIKVEGLTYEYHSGYDSKREVQMMGKLVAKEYGRRYRIKYERGGKHPPYSIFDPRVKYALYNTPKRERRVR